MISKKLIKSDDRGLYTEYTEEEGLGGGYMRLLIFLSVCVLMRLDEMLLLRFFGVN